MKAARLQAYGDVDQFSYEDAPDPVVGAGEVLVKVAASGLNPVDSYIRQGYLAKFVPLAMPAILGLDGAGTIIALGTGVTGFAVGDRVLAHLPVGNHGFHAEHAAVPLAGLAHLPDNVSLTDAATLGVAGLTAWQCVATLGVKRGDRVLVSGALGSVGRASVACLKLLGAVPVAGVRAARLAEGRAVAGEALDIDLEPKSQDFDFAVSTAAPVAPNLFRHVRDGGMVASAVQVPEGGNERVRVASISTVDNPTQLQAIADAAGRGELVLPIAATFALKDLAAAHKKLGEPHLGGKIIIVP
jgi:NADPH:quinone reductase-like Zn-dependent oxidoreductase